jgi:SAM-dependent methyltransferase
MSVFHRERVTGLVSKNEEIKGDHSQYMLANKSKESSTRFAALAALYDRRTTDHLTRLGVTYGWRCLEVGGGSGTIAKWLADRVGPMGYVLATDLDTRFLELLRSPTLKVLCHDISSDPLPEGAFDLIHTRLVLMHLPRRDTALTQMISSLKPGGWLLMEEYDSCSVRPDPVAYPGETSLKTHLAMLRFLEANGVDRQYGRLLPGRMQKSGLTSVGAEAELFMLGRDTPGAAMMRANFEQLREAMINGNYITQQQFDEDLARLDDPAFMMPSSILWTVWGRRP